ncbi:MAG: hypothetical protein N2Z20_01415 [Elusimicrobiales bacterium]|nr:hypothetical protein [Elusimicrobiales bacterium]
MLRYEIDEEIYSYEALKVAKNIVDKDEIITIQPRKTKIEIIIEKDDNLLFHKFINESLSQQCRLDTIKRNAKVAEMLTTLAIVSAIGNKRGK